MKNAAIQERRNRQILADLVRMYIETGEPVFFAGDIQTI